MARQGDSADQSAHTGTLDDLTVPSLMDHAVSEGRRHRAASDLRLPRLTNPDANRFRPHEDVGPRPASTVPPGSKDATGALTDELRGALWHTVASFVFVAADGDVGRWEPVTRATVHRVWTAAPISGDPNEMPEEIADLIEEWFSIAAAGDAYALLESVLACLPDPDQARFAAACNGVLEQGFSDHRFIGRRLLPIASRTDMATIERALAACRARQLGEPERHLVAALDHLAAKPEPDASGTVHEAIRAVQAAAFALTRERPLDLDDALALLEEQGHIDAAMKARHGGLFAWVAQNARRPRAEDARLILVTCAGFVAQLATRLG